MAKVKFENLLNCMIFEVSGVDSFERIQEVLFDYCDETARTNPDIVVKAVKYPVYYKEINGSLMHIGYVNLEYDRSETVYIIRHFTEDNKELHNEWNPFRFYKGEYGLKPLSEEMNNTKHHK
ncbi:TPA: hypothetical protein ACY2HE_003556 [Yersinia enterocolitica]